MKKSAIVIALATFAGAAIATPGDVPVPTTGLPGSAPSLYPSEQGAFKAMEVATQVLESVIVQKGCINETYPFEVHTSSDGSGTALLGAAPTTVALNVNLVGASANNGRKYRVDGGGSISLLPTITISNISATGSFNIGSSLQEVKSTWNASSAVTTNLDFFSGSIIKDYWRLSSFQPIPDGFDDAGTPVSTVVDYGYQQVSKNNYIKAKYWQNSRTWRENGVNAGTYWVKTRVVPSGVCSIQVKIAGYGESPADSIEGFNEKGTMSIVGPTITPFSAKR